MTSRRFLGLQTFAVLYLLIPSFASAATLASVSSPRAVSTEVNQALQNSLASSISLLQAATTSATLEAYAEPPIDAIADDAPLPSDIAPKKSKSLKKNLKPGVKLVSEPGVSKRPRPTAGMSLADFLAMQLGPKFHRRAAWSGNRPEYMPLTSRKRTWGPMVPFARSRFTTLKAYPRSIRRK